MENVFKEIQGVLYIPQSIDYLSMMIRQTIKHVSYMQPIYKAISNSLDIQRYKSFFCHSLYRKDSYHFDVPPLYSQSVTA